jgi:hypothetical protein
VVNPNLSTADELNSTQKDSPPKQQSFHVQQQQHIQSIQTVSPLSSPEIPTIDSMTSIESKIISQMSISDRIQKSNSTSDKSNWTQEIVELNPLSTILSNEELLLFATQPISPQTTLQCTIIRDKKGFDRSFYPTYYMHLQGMSCKSNQLMINNMIDRILSNCTKR